MFAGVKPFQKKSFMKRAVQLSARRQHIYGSYLDTVLDPVGTPRGGVPGGKAAGIVGRSGSRHVRCARFTGAAGAARRCYREQCQATPSFMRRPFLSLVPRRLLIPWSPRRGGVNQSRTIGVRRGGCLGSETFREELPA